MSTSNQLPQSAILHFRSLNMAARVVSDVFNPAVLGVPFLVLAAVASDDASAYRAALVYFLLAIPGPFCYIAWLVSSKRVTDIHLSVRRQRTGPFAVSLGAALIGLMVLYALKAPTVLLVALLAAFVQTLILFAITLFWKISIHTAAISGVITFATILFGSTALLFTPLVPLVAWARVYLRRHTLPQTVAGGLLGYLTFVMMYGLRGIAW